MNFMFLAFSFTPLANLASKNQNLIVSASILFLMDVLLPFLGAQHLTVDDFILRIFAFSGCAGACFGHYWLSGCLVRGLMFCLFSGIYILRSTSLNLKRIIGFAITAPLVVAAFVILVPKILLTSILFPVVAGMAAVAFTIRFHKQYRLFKRKNQKVGLRCVLLGFFVILFVLELTYPLAEAVFYWQLLPLYVVCFSGGIFLINLAMK